MLHALRHQPVLFASDLSTVRAVWSPGGARLFLRLRPLVARQRARRQQGVRLAGALQHHELPALHPARHHGVRSPGTSRQPPPTVTEHVQFVCPKTRAWAGFPGSFWIIALRYKLARFCSRKYHQCLQWYSRARTHLISRKYVTHAGTHARTHHRCRTKKC